MSLPIPEVGQHQPEEQDFVRAYENVREKYKGNVRFYWVLTEPLRRGAAEGTRPNGSRWSWFWFWSVWMSSTLQQSFIPGHPGMKPANGPELFSGLVEETCWFRQRQWFWFWFCWFCQSVRLVSMCVHVVAATSLPVTPHHFLSGCCMASC